ncbi:hypothetical protein [Croceicoccus sp. Ery15]|uniref:hypothetical protein n=1 Tax=Croceicoccus sp. Ery15 TaxID=1703338 RepID=UPI001E605DCA|nr:hypothetical protein [Croceicoccus sp. Ery15]
MKQMYAQVHEHNALNDNDGIGDIAAWLDGLKRPADGGARGFRRTIDSLMNG